MATQESSLRVGVDSRDAERGAKRVEQALDKMGRSAKATETQFERLQNSLGGFSTVMAGLGLGYAAAEFVRLLDVTTNMDNRLRLVTNSQAELNAVYEELYEISNRTRSSIEANADVFNRLAMATQNMGLTYREQLDLVEQLNQAMIISGTTAQEGSAALRQLGQALGAGKLSGDEFISVNENLPRVMQAVADKMGVTRGELKKLASEGKITADVLVGAMRDAAPQLAEEFAKVAPTIEGAFTVLSNKLLDFIRGANNATGIGQILAQGVLLLADNFNTLVGAVAGVATIIMGRLIQALAAMTVAMTANPIGLVITAVAALTAALGFLADQTFQFGETTATGWQVAKAAVLTAYQVFMDAFNYLKEAFTGYYEQISGFVTETWQKLQSWTQSWDVSLGSIGDLIKGAVNTWIGIYVAAFQSIKDVWSDLPALFEYVVKAAANLVAAGVEKIVDIFVSGLAKIGSAVDAFAGTDLASTISESLSIDLGRLNAGEAAATLARAGSNISRNFNESLNFDYVGAAGDALEAFTGDIMQRFDENLQNIVKSDAEAAAAADLLNNKFREGTAAATENAEATKKLAKEKEKFVSTLEREYNRMREANGSAVQVVEEWYAKQSEKLKALGLENTQYADQLEYVYQERLAQARIKDVENAQAWAAGLTAAQRSVAESIQTEWQAIQEANGGAEESVRQWYENQKALLEAAGLDHTAYVDKLDEIFQNRIKEARLKDLENAEDWASGVKRAILKMNEQMGSEADMMEDIFTGAFNKMAGALSEFVKTGKLDFKDLARSIAADIMQITMKMLILKALKSTFGMGFSEGGVVEAASGGYIKGPGTSTSDSIPARLSDGEYVVNAKSTAKYFDLLKAINDDKLPEFATGGMVASQPTLMKDEQPVVPLSQKNTTDKSDKGQKNKGDRAEAPKVEMPEMKVRVINVMDPKESLAALDTAEGEQTIMNVIERNPGALRRILGAN